MEFDSLLTFHLGEFGTYQKLIILLVCSAGINIALNDMDYVFSGITPPFRCDIKGIGHLTSNLSFDEILQLTSPASNKGDIDACLVILYNYSSLTLDESKRILDHDNNSRSGMKQFSIEKCESWIFDINDGQTTIVTEWDLVCEKKWFVATCQSAYLFGFFTSFIGGFCADRFGRRPVELGCLILTIACYILVVMSPNVYVFMFGRFLLGGVAASWYSNLCIYAMEHVGPSKRTLAGITAYIFWAVGYMILSGLAYLIRNWRTRNLIYIAFCFPFLLHFCFLKESARWLKAKGRIEDSISVVKLMARVNKKTFSEDLVCDWKSQEKSDFPEETNPRLVTLFRSWLFIRITVIQTAIWMCVNAVYYGMTFYIPSLGGNIYLNALIAGALELLALIYVYLTLDSRLGRKYNSFLLFLIAGVMLLLMIFVPSDLAWLKISLAQVGRFAAAAIFGILFISTSEIFPTRIRTIGLGICSSVSRISSVFSPYLAKLGQFGTFIPPLLFCGLSILAALLFLLLPETRGKALEDFNIQCESEPKQSKNRSDGYYRIKGIDGK